ncbi:MAG: FAD-dependent oxidoreductase [Spirochaetales bacterium]|jgi:hypothetical protein|nr:FAD-dependent oxidoreductase [Spirochaetales bacterium]
MVHITEPERQIPVIDEVDVLVAGAGPAGLAAAISSARLGARTLLIEQFGEVGGMSTIGMMSHWTGSTRGGIYEEFLNRSCDASPDMLAENGFYRQAINPEILKTVYLDILDQAGAELRLYTMVVDSIMDGNRITGVIIESKSGREAIHAKVVIDASGDGDVAARSGVSFQKGRKADGLMQPMTLMFKVGGVDTGRAVFPGGFEDNIEIPQGMIQDLGKAELPHPAGHVLLYRTTLPGVVTCNMTNITGVDGTKTRDLTTAHIGARGQIAPVVSFLRSYVPGYEECYVVSSASWIGVRETRHIAGEYVLSDEDILSARIFEDWAVSFAHFNFDVHNITGSGLDETGAQKQFPQAAGYTIPYRCIVPVGIDGLLLAGRNISGTHLAHSNYRVMPICANIGQASGTAGALCASEGCLPRNLPVPVLQEVLLQHGVLDPHGGV